LQITLPTGRAVDAFRLFHGTTLVSEQLAEPAVLWFNRPWKRL
jgi:hypothetical protein